MDNAHVGSSISADAKKEEHEAAFDPSHVGKVTITFDGAEIQHGQMSHHERELGHVRARFAVGQVHTAAVTQRRRR